MNLRSHIVSVAACTAILGLSSLAIVHADPAAPSANTNAPQLSAAQPVTGAQSSATPPVAAPVGQPSAPAPSTPSTPASTAVTPPANPTSKTSTPAQSVDKVTVTTPPLDPKVAALLSQIKDAHKLVTKLSGIVLLENSDGAKFTIDLGMNLPDAAHFAVHDKSGKLIVNGAANAKTAGIFYSDDNKFDQEDVPKDKSFVLPLLSRTRSKLVAVFVDPDPFTSALTELGARFGSADTIDGDRCDALVGDMEPDKITKGHVVAYFRQSDHLIKRLVVTVTTNKDGKDVSMTESNTLTKLNLSPKFADADFVFTAPKGASQVAASQALPATDNKSAGNH